MATPAGGRAVEKSGHSAMPSLQLVVGSSVDVPAVQKQTTHAEAEAQTLPIQRKEVGTSPAELTSRTTQTDRLIGTPLSARQIRISAAVLERVLSELQKAEEEHPIFADLDAFHRRRSMRLVQFRTALVETTEKLPICGVACGSERRVAILCGERVHSSWCLHTGRIAVLQGSQRFWTHLGSCPSAATFGPHGQLIVGGANGEMLVISEGEILWTSTQMHLQAITSLRWISGILLLSSALDGRLVMSSVQPGGLEPVKSSSVSIDVLPRAMKKANNTSLKVGIVSTTSSDGELFVATDTGAILQVDADTLEAKPLGYEIEGLEQLEMSNGRLFAVNAANEAKVLERNGATVEWLGLRNVLSMVNNKRGLLVFLAASEIVALDVNSLEILMREPTRLAAVDFDESGSLVGILEGGGNSAVDSHLSACWFRFSEA